MKVTIYIVDDEIMAIEYLKFLLEKVDLEYEVVGVATDSAKAFYEIVRLKPDVVFVDISMPVMDGLKLAEEILKRIQKRIILLTSYRDFEYVQKGIQIGVADYILKNDLNENVLTSILKKAVSDLKIEKQKRHRMLEYNVRQFLLNQSVNMPAGDYIYSHKPMQRYAMIGIYRPSRIYMKHQTNMAEAEFDCYELYQLSCPVGLECGAYTEMPDNQFYGIYFIHGEVTDSQIILQKMCKSIQHCLEEQGLKYRCMISETTYSFLELQTQYREMRILRDYLYQYKGLKIFEVEELKKSIKPAEIIHFPWETLNSALELGREHEAEDVLKKLFSLFKVNQNVWEYTDHLRSLKHHLRDFIRKHQLNEKIIDIPDWFESAEDAEHTFSNCLLQIMKDIKKREKKLYSPNVQLAQEYIRKNYNRDISIPDIAEAVKISEGHLRRLFKQEMGVKVVDYLTEYRLECAKLMMKNSENTLNEIWKKTGFTSAQYFSYVFKKKEGVLPKEYMKQIRNG